MIKPAFIVALATSLAVAACSKTSPPESAAAGQAASPPPSAQRDAPPAPPPASAASAPAPAAPGQKPPAAATRAGAPRASAVPQSAAAPSTPAAAAPSRPAPAQSPEPQPPPAPTFREVTIPAGTALSVTVLSTLASNTSKVEDPVRGSLAKPIVVSGTTAVPAGAELSGSVIDVKESGRVKGKASLAFRFERLGVRGETVRIQTARVTREAEQDKASDVKKGALGGGLGAVVGGVVGGGKGAAIGAVAGGAGAVLGTRGDEVQVAPGTVVTVLLQEALTVSVPIE